MKTIAFLFAATVALGASISGIQAAPLAAPVPTQGITQSAHHAVKHADEISAQQRHHSTHRHSTHRHHPHSRSHHHWQGKNWHRSHRHHRHCRQVWNHGRWVTVCR